MNRAFFYPFLFVCSLGCHFAGAETLTGEAAKGDWTTDAPGVRRKLTVADLPPPFETKSAANGANIIPRPEGAMPRVPAGFAVNVFAEKLEKSRKITAAPNGDIFIAESSSNRITVLRDSDGDGVADNSEIFADGLKQPFGIAFYPPGDSPTHVYVANTDSVVRFPYERGQLKTDAKPEIIIDDLSGGGLLRGGGHWTRDIVFSLDGKKLYVSIGSKSNVDDNEVEQKRARIFEVDPDGKNERTFASGIRNPVGLAVDPATGELWTSVNERDGLGDHLVPDYITKVKEGGFYGWPWFYLGDHQDPRHDGAHPEFKGKVIVPDVLLQSHSASLCLTPAAGTHFPNNWKSGFFAAEHGSWNRSRRTGYKVIFVPTNDGKAIGEYVDFLTGFVTDNGDVWARPVGVAVAKDGSLLVSDDGGNRIWRVSYKK